MINFKFDKDTLLVMQEGDTEEYPSEWIPVTQLGDVDEFGKNTSFWINHLSEFSSVSKSSLYFLAKIIQDKCPENKIDWFKTFYDIEFHHLVSCRKKEILALKPSQREFDAIDHSESIKAWLAALEEIKKIFPTGKIAAMVQENAARYKVSLT